MTVKLNGDFATSQKDLVKRAMKGRPLYFGVQAQGAKRGKFLVSKRPGEVKAGAVKELAVYEGDGKDAKKARELNKVAGSPAMGVCVGDKGTGTLRLCFERGKALPVAEKFVKHFVTREVKFKLVKQVVVSEMDQLPTVPDENSKDDQPVTQGSVDERVGLLAARLARADKNNAGLALRLQQAKVLAATKPERADDDLDEVEFAVCELEQLKRIDDEIAALAAEKAVKDQVEAAKKCAAQARKDLAGSNFDAASESLDSAEESLEQAAAVLGWRRRQDALEAQVKTLLKEDADALSKSDKKHVLQLLKASEDSAARQETAKAGAAQDGVELILAQGRAARVSDRLVAARDALNLSRSEKSELNLKDNAHSVAKSLGKLHKQLPPAIYGRLEAEFDAISRRVQSAADKGDKAAAALEAQQLNVLARQLDVLLDDSAKQQKRFDEAVRGHADALIADVRARDNPQSADELAAALVKRMQSLMGDKHTTGDQTAVTLRAIHLLARREWAPDGQPAAPTDNVDPLVKAAAQKASESLVALHEQRMQAVGPSEAERDAPRAPSEVVIHLQRAVEQALGKDPKNAALKKLLGTLRQTYLKHDLTVESTRKLLAEARKTCETGNLPELAKLSESLLGQIPAKSGDMPATRLHENIYGRVFDSQLIGDLVQDPPEGVKTSMKEAGTAMADLLDELGAKNANNNWAGNKIKEYLNSKDPRFWVPKVPGLEKVKNAKDSNEALTELKAYLRADKTNGQECVAMPWVLCKLSLFLTATGGSPWMDEANKNYNGVIMKQTGRDKPMVPDGQKLETEGAGITLRHQPPAVKEDWMVPSQRPTTINRPQIGGEDMAGHDTSGGPRTTDAIQEALAHGAPYASGVSGSTNIMLHLLKHLKDKGKAIDTRDYLLGTMMFLVYDGGHSIHEVLWTANQLNAQLDLKLDLGGDSSKPNEFVADYEKFAAVFGDKTGAAVQRATDSAWKGVGAYFDQHSYFAEGGTTTTTGSTSQPTTTPQPTTTQPTSPGKSGGGGSPQTPPARAANVIDSSLPPNPTLYAIPNSEGTYNFRVSRSDPGGDWYKVEQFCAYLAAEWLKRGAPNSGLAFSGLANQDAAIRTVSGWASEGGYAQQVNWAAGELGGATVTTKDLKQKVLDGTYGDGTKIWFGNDTHVCAAVIKTGRKVVIYDPDKGSTSTLDADLFAKSPPFGANVFVVA